MLLYHGVHPDGLELGLKNSSGKHIPRERFAREMQWLSENRSLISMRDIARAHLGEADIPEDAVAVTFDDGFHNNYTEAWPVLEAFQVPATIYLATGFIDSGHIIWTDRLEAAITETRRTVLELKLDGEWRIWPLTRDGERLAALRDVKSYCKAATNQQKDEIVGMVEACLEAPANLDHPLYAFMNWDQAREMNRSPLIDFGGHTVDHLSLARIGEEEMRRQIDGSVERLESELAEKCDLFSYPEGQAGDFDAKVVAHLRFRGFTHCPTAMDGINRIGETDPFEIRRIMVGFEGRPFPFEAFNS